MGARETALCALIACRKEGAWSNSVLKEYTRRDGLDSRDAGLAARLCYGVLQNRAKLDFYLKQLLTGKLRDLHPVVRDILHMGLYQIYELDKIPDSAAVNESVSLVKKYNKNPRAASLVNGVLRSAVRTKGTLKEPTSYADLLNPIYKGLISMPDPKASGTGYMFYLSLVNTWGVEVALPYFDRLAENVLSFTSSGSGPVNALVGKEVAIALGMTAHAVQEINNGENLEILFFDQGSPYSLYGQGIIAGNETDEAVVEVFKYLAGELTVELCANFYPEKIFADTDFTLENFPQNIHYADMSNNTPERKAELLAKWMH